MEQSNQDIAARSEVVVVSQEGEDNVFTEDTVIEIADIKQQQTSSSSEEGDAEQPSTSNSMVIEVEECNEEQESECVNIDRNRALSDTGVRTEVAIEVNEPGHCDEEYDISKHAKCNCDCHAKMLKMRAATLPNAVSIRHEEQQQQQGSSTTRRGSSFVMVDGGSAAIEQGVDNAAFSFNREVSTISTASSVKPPAYGSLGEFYLNDEPPKYESITGKKLDDQLQETSANPTVLSVRPASHNRSTGLNCKSKVAGTLILIGIILITGLLAYLSIANENNTNERRS